MRGHAVHTRVVAAVSRLLPVPPACTSAPGCDAVSLVAGPRLLAAFAHAAAPLLTDTLTVLVDLRIKQVIILAIPAIQNIGGDNITGKIMEETARRE